MAEAEKKEEVHVVKNSETWKTWLLGIMSIFTALLLYYNIAYAKNFTIQITGEQVIVLAALLIAFAWWWFQRRKEIELPPKDVIAREVSNWAYIHGMGILDYAECTVAHIGEKRALIYYPRAGRTYTVRAAPNNHIEVIEEEWMDLQSTLIGKEHSKLLDAHARAAAAHEKTLHELSDRGLASE